jgi:hydroxymethylbilane synthase
MDFEVTPADVLIFTSPSSVRAYFNKYSVKSNQEVIAMGPSTAEALKNSGIKSPLLPSIPGEIGLVNLLESL